MEITLEIIHGMALGGGLTVALFAFGYNAYLLFNWIRDRIKKPNDDE